MDDPSLERALFLVDNKPEGAPTSISQLISDRAIAYLNVTAIGRKPTA